jgi:hypothetical protein
LGLLVAIEIRRNLFSISSGSLILSILITSVTIVLHVLHFVKKLFGEPLSVVSGVRARHEITGATCWKALDLEDTKFAILELAKGKLTTAPDRHSGEGIFFTSRVFDTFYIMSATLIFFGHRDKDLIVDDKTEIKGTAVTMTIHRDSKTTIKSVFDEYTSDAGDDYAFVRTVIPVKLMQYEGEALMSRSQAKRLIMRFERFREVVLNFEGVKMIGQAFADEIFRVFKAAHPEVNLMIENADDSILNMVNWVKKSSL